MLQVAVMLLADIIEPVPVVTILLDVVINPVEEIDADCVI